MGLGQVTSAHCWAPLQEGIPPGAPKTSRNRSVARTPTHRSVATGVHPAQKRQRHYPNSNAQTMRQRKSQMRTSSRSPVLRDIHSRLWAVTRVPLSSNTNLLPIWSCKMPAISLFIRRRGLDVSFTTSEQANMQAALMWDVALALAHQFHSS